MGIVSVGSGQDAMVIRGIGDLLADVDHVAINDGKRSSIHKAVDERRVWILKNLLDSAAELVSGWVQLWFSIAITKTVLICSAPALVDPMQPTKEICRTCGHV